MENNRLSQNSDKIDSINNEETNGNNKKSRNSEKIRIFGSSQDEIAEEVDTSLHLDSINNEETNGNNTKSRNSEKIRIFGSSQDEIAEEVDTSHSSKTFNSIAKTNGSNSEPLRNSSVNQSIAWSPDTNNTTNKKDGTINSEPYNNGNIVADENSKDSVSVISPQTIKKRITLSEKSKNINNRTQSAPTTKTKESVVEEATSGVTKCTIECTKGIKGANVKNGDGKGKCILCEIEKIIKTKDRVSRSGSTSKNVTCGADCGRSSKGKKKGDNVKKLKCMKSLDCKKTAPECKSKKRPKRILSIRNISETCLPPDKETSKKVICSTCPNSDEEESSTKRGGGGEAEGNLNDTQSTGKGKKGNKRCQKMRNFCRKLCACCRKKSKDDEEEDKDNEGNGNGSQRKGKRRRKKKKKPQKRFPEGKKPPCAGKSNNMTRFYGRRPACHAGFGMCHPCHPPWTPARLPFFACSTPHRKKRVHSS